jgi:hypothetical protein
VIPYDDTGQILSAERIHVEPDAVSFHDEVIFGRRLLIDFQPVLEARTAAGKNCYPDSRREELLPGARPFPRSGSPPRKRREPRPPPPR